eukprot:s3124_g2.t1
MGKKGGAGPQRTWRAPVESYDAAPATTGQHASWQWWPGAWSGERRARRQEAQRYNDMVVPSSGRSRQDGPLGEEASLAHPTSEKMRAIQKFLTQARKAEGRARKLREDQAHRDQQWEAWAQKFLTQARKAEGRARKLREDQAHRDQQWEAWAKSMKTTYVKQRKQYEADSAKAATDLQEALDAGRQAAHNVELVVAGQLPFRQPDPTDDHSWEDFLETPDTSQQGEAFMKEALAAAQRAGLGAHQASATMPGATTAAEAQALASATMPGATTAAEAQALVKQIRPEILQQLMMMTGAPEAACTGRAAAAPPAAASVAPVAPTAYTSAPPSAAPTEVMRGTGPYPPSSPNAGSLPVPVAEPPTEQRPAAKRAALRTSPLHPGQRDLAMPRQPTSEAPPRSSIKEATKAPPRSSIKEATKVSRGATEGPSGPSLATKLEQARAEAMHGGALQAEHAGAPATDIVPQFNLEDDDPDEALDDRSSGHSLNNLS